MSTRYAANTSVSSEASRMEIERTVRRYGASGFMYAFNDTQALVEFVLKERRIRFVLDMPDFNDREFTHTPSKGLRRSPSAQEEAYEQAVRQRWRALNLVIKAKLEAVAAGILEFDREFLAHVVLPDGYTVGDRIAPKVAEAYALGSVPTDLLALPGGQTAKESND